MKTIILKCPCGASIQLEDAAESYINGKTGEPDKKGRRFLIEVRADEWQDRHQKCTDLKNQLLLKASELKTTPKDRAKRLICK